MSSAVVHISQLNWTWSGQFQIRVLFVVAEGGPLHFPGVQSTDQVPPYWLWKPRCSCWSQLQVSLLLCLKHSVMAFPFIESQDPYCDLPAFWPRDLLSPAKKKLLFLLAIHLVSRVGKSQFLEYKPDVLHPLRRRLLWGFFWKQLSKFHLKPLSVLICKPIHRSEARWMVSWLHLFLFVGKVIQVFLTSVSTSSWQLVWRLSR